MRDQRASSAVRHKQGLWPCAFERLVEPRYPIGTVRRFPVILDNTFHGRIHGFPAALPMAGIGVIKARKNERARHAAAPGAADTPNVPSTISTKLRSSRGMKRLASAAAKLLRASGSAFSFFLYGFVRRKAVESDQSPGDVIRALIRQKVAHEMTTAPWDDMAPDLCVIFEGISLVWIDFVSDDAGNFYCCFHRYRFSPNNITAHGQCRCESCSKPHKFAAI